LAQLEVEFHLPRRRSIWPTHTIIRLNHTNEKNELKAAQILANRPKKNSDWTVVVALTPERPNPTD
jgi:hypothetical protein